MAIYHLKMNIGKSNSKAHYDYIMRENNFKNYKKQEDLIYKKNYNLPYWAEGKGNVYWNAVNQYEKGTHYREFEIALPIEYTDNQNIILTQEFCEKVFGKNYTYSFAIHKNVGSLSGKENPHAHIMFSERLIDHNRKQEPTKSEYFIQRRKDKETGEYKNGYAKDRNITGVNRKDWLKDIRGLWELIQNKSLKEHLIDQKVSCRTLKEQGIERIPQIHLGAAAINRKKRNLSSERFDEWKEIDLCNVNIKDIEKDIKNYSSAIHTIREKESIIENNKALQMELSKDITMLERKRQTLQDNIDIIPIIIKENRKLIREHNLLQEEIKKYEEQGLANKIFKKTIGLMGDEDTEYKKYISNKERVEEIQQNKELKEYIKDKEEYKKLLEKSIEDIQPIERELNIKGTSYRELVKDTKAKEKEIDALLNKNKSKTQVTLTQEEIQELMYGKNITKKQRNKGYDLER